MTVYQAYMEALKLLGYTHEDGSITVDGTLLKILTFANAIMVEIKGEEFEPFTKISDVIPLSKRQIYDLFIYGLCMWIASDLADGDKQQIFASLYEQKKHLLTKRYEIEDTFLR